MTKGWIVQNGFVRTAAFGLALVTAVVFVVLWVADIKASATDNLRRVEALEGGFDGLSERIERIDRRQVYFMIKMGVSRDEIPD